MDGCVLLTENRITALKVQKRNPNRVNVYLDGEFAFGLSRIVAAWLNIGQILTEEKKADLFEKELNEVALQKAIRFLEYRPRTRMELLRKLKSLGYEEVLIQRVMDRLQENGMIADDQYAELYVESRSTHHPRSHRVIAQELRSKGVADETIESALAGAADDSELAYQTALRYVRRLASLERDIFRQKLGSYLARRGFSYIIAAPVILQVWEELHEQAPD